VVDDAIVVMEKHTRHLESGMKPFAGSAQGCGGNRFYPCSPSAFRLIAVFIPLLLMAGSSVVCFANLL